MASEDKERWEKGHTEIQEDGGPSEFLKLILEQGPWLIEPGKAFDVASGKGRNAVFLAEKGFTVYGADISEAAVNEARKGAAKRGLSINFTQTDLEHADFPETAYDLVINFNFLLRSLIPRLKRALKLGGHMIFETYLVDQAAVGHPKNPAYLLNHNELLELFRDFRILFYREGKFTEGHRAGLLGQKIRRESSLK